MLRRPLAIAIVAGLIAGLACAQTGSPILDPNNTSRPTAAQADRPADEKPQITPELRGDIHMAKKEYREAVDAFREGSPKDPVLWNKIGIAYQQLTQLDTALKSYQQAVRLKRDYVEAINNIGTVYYARKNYRRAVTYYQRAIKLMPHDARAASFYANLAAAYLSRKQYKEAYAASETAMSLDPEVFEHRGTYGVILEERNVEERAKWHYYVAKLYAKSGRNELALQYLRKALEEGFKERKQLENDPEFAALRDLKEFQDLLALEPRVL
jgi:tetratricopeptide (TPR) repeat protein